MHCRKALLMSDAIEFTPFDLTQCSHMCTRHVELAYLDGQTLYFVWYLY